MPKEPTGYVGLLRGRAFRSSARIVLSDGLDPRTAEAARLVASESGIRLLVIGPGAEVRAQFGARAADRLEVYDPAADPRQQQLEDLLNERMRKSAGRMGAVTDIAALARQPSYCAALLVEAGLADGMVGGATVPTAEVIRAGIRVIGVRPESPVVSGAFAMLLKAPLQSGQDALVFADSAVVPNPTAEQVASIARNTGAITRTVLGLQPVVALLSFSTYGSAEDASVTKMRRALELLREQTPELEVDGELQADAALVPDVGSRKAPGSRVAGRANVLIFPNLDAGNIAYKLVERIAGATALGVLLSGFRKPVNDLSRGCSAADIVNMVAVTALEASAAEESS